MSTAIAFAPLPSAIPAPVRTTDVFDFLHARKEDPNPESRITVAKCDSPDLLTVAIRSADGRCLRRQVPASRWQEKAYRSALVRRMSQLVA